MTLQNKNSERGFTIVELLIVIIVIGILATLVLIAYGNVQGQARDTKRQSSAQSIANASEQFKVASTNGQYPRTDSGANFQADITNTTLYTNGTASISIDKSVTGDGTTTYPNQLSNTLSNVATGTGASQIAVVYCGTGTPTYATATGMKVYYWSESAKAQKFVQSGTGC